MKINQLFTLKMDIQIVLSLIKCFSLNSLYDKKMFCKYDILKNNTLEKAETVLKELEKYYLPCKSKIYLENITEKKIITVLKQVLRLHGYYLHSIEKNYNNRKITFYQIIDEKDRQKSNKMKTYHITNVLNFN